MESSVHKCYPPPPPPGTGGSTRTTRRERRPWRPRRVRTKCETHIYESSYGQFINILLCYPTQKKQCRRSAFQHLYWSVFDHRVVQDLQGWEEKKEKWFVICFIFTRCFYNFVSTVSGFTFFTLFSPSRDLKGLQDHQEKWWVCFLHWHTHIKKLITEGL